MRIRISKRLLHQSLVQMAWEIRYLDYEVAQPYDYTEGNRQAGTASGDVNVLLTESQKLLKKVAERSDIPTELALELEAAMNALRGRR